MDNLILKTDSYKFSHWKQYPPGTQFVRSYMCPRGGPYAKVLTFGALQVFLNVLFARPITKHMIDEAESYVTPHMGPGIFNRAGWEHILKAHDGYMPLRIRAVPEGMFIPIKNAVMTVENTDPQVPWLTNYFETAMYPWYPYTVATLAHHCRQIIMKYLQQTGDPAGIDFKLHDFGYRGTTDPYVGWQAAIGGLAQLLSFKGTDSPPALWAGRSYYNCPMAGFSIPAAEHSTITSWGREHEVDAYRNMLQSYPTGLVAVVSDSYDIYAACEHLWGETLRDEVLNRAGVLVIRPDSGHPPEVVMKVLRILDAKYGNTVNAKGFKVLHPKVRVIQGDGIDPTMIDMVLSVMAINGYSADNLAYGMGGALVQKVDRDTMKWAFKCMQIVVDGQERDVFKSPIGDPTKKSQGGNLTLYKTHEDPGGHHAQYATLPRNADLPYQDMLRIVYENGRVFIRENFDTIRERVRLAELAEAADPVLV